MHDLERAMVMNNVLMTCQEDMVALRTVLQHPVTCHRELDGDHAPLMQR